MRKVNLITPNGEDSYRKLCEQACKNEGETPQRMNWDGPERHVFYCDLGMTRDMDEKFKRAKKERYDIRWLPNDLWEKYSNKANKKRIMKI